jgi:ribosomal protein S1
MKIQVGKKITVTVTKVAEFGVFCQWQDKTGLIVIPETSWIASYNSCLQFTSTGNTHEVLITSIDSTGSDFSASIRALYPNPWLQNSLAYGTIHRAKIVRSVEQSDRCNNCTAYLVEIMSGAYAMLCEEQLTLKKDDFCNVIITESTPEKYSIKLASYSHNNN